MKIQERKVQGPALFYKKFLAFLLDLIILEVIVVAPFKSLIESILPISSWSATLSYINSNSAALSSLSFVIFIIGLLGLLYFAVLEYKIGQTFGMMAMNIFVKPTEKKKELKFWHCMARNLFMLPIFPFILLWVVEPIYLFFSKSNQRFTESLTNTALYEMYTI